MRKWLKVCREIEWRAPIASLNFVLTSHVWRQDHNGYSHQDPGFLDHVVNKKAEIIRVYLPPDANTLLAVTDECLRSRDKINVVGEHPHGLSHTAFDQIFTTDKPVIFAFHGYPALIHKLTYRRTNHANVHVRGYKEEGTTTTPFDMLVLNDLDRYHLAMDVIDRVQDLGTLGVEAKQYLIDQRLRHKRYIVEHGEDMPEVREWRWRSKNWDQRPV